MPWINGKWRPDRDDWLDNMSIWDDLQTIYDKGPGTTLIPSNFPSPRNTLPGIFDGGDGVTPGYNPTEDASIINESITTQAQAPAATSLFSMPGPYQRYEAPQQQVRYMAPRTPMTPTPPPQMMPPLNIPGRLPAPVQQPIPPQFPSLPPQMTFDPPPRPPEFQPFPPPQPPVRPPFINPPSIERPPRPPVRPPLPPPPPKRDTGAEERARRLAQQKARAANQRATDLASQRQAAANQRARDLASQRAQAASQAQAARAQAQARAVIANAAGRDRGGPSSRDLAAAREVLSQVDTFGGGRITGDRNGGAAGALGGYRGDPVGRQAAIESRGGGRGGGGRGGPGGRGR